MSVAAVHGVDFRQPWLAGHISPRRSDDPMSRRQTMLSRGSIEDAPLESPGLLGGDSASIISREVMVLAPAASRSRREVG